MANIPSQGKPYNGGGGRDFETREERAAKQVYIVRQSSLTAAIATMTPGSKTALNPEDVINVAKQYEQYVFTKEDVTEVVAKEIPSLEDIDDDIPY